MAFSTYTWPSDLSHMHDMNLPRLHNLIARTSDLSMWKPDVTTTNLKPFIHDEHGSINQMHLDFICLKFAKNLEVSHIEFHVSSNLKNQKIKINSSVQTSPKCPTQTLHNVVLFLTILIFSSAPLHEGQIIKINLSFR